MEQRKSIVQKMLERWSGYCTDNWLSPNVKTNIFAPEIKVKSFLSTLGYFLIMGSADDIVTDYKEIMHGKREIPMSFCPSYIENELYSKSHVGEKPEHVMNEENNFRAYVERMDAKAEKRYGVRAKRKKAKVTHDTYYDKLKKIQAEYGDIEIYRSIVDTDNVFSYGGQRYRVDPDKYEKYSPVETDAGLFYAMDRVLCVKPRNHEVIFYDQSLNRIPDDAIERQ